MPSLQNYVVIMAAMLRGMLQRPDATLSISAYTGGVGSPDKKGIANAQDCQKHSHMNNNIELCFI